MHNELEAQQTHALVEEALRTAKAREPQLHASFRQIAEARAAREQLLKALGEKEGLYEALEVKNKIK